MQRMRSGCLDYLRTEAFTRRALLRAGVLGAAGVALPTLFRAESKEADYGVERPTPRAKSCILLFLSGGPSCQETFDPKPEAPSESRTIFETIRTQVPGTLLCEHLADLAPLADKFALVRAVHHTYGGHFGGHRYVLSGFPAVGAPDQPARPDDRPGIASLAGKHLSPRNAFPRVLMLPWPATDQGSGASGGMLAGTLGKQYDPLLVEADAARASARDRKALPAEGDKPFFRVPEISLRAGITLEQLTSRRTLLNEVESQRRGLLESANTAAMSDLYRRAYDLLTSPRIKEGFDVEQESLGLRDKYGANAFGQSCLLARRLVERGARFVQVNFSRFVTQPGYGWDTHEKGRDTLKEHLLPKLNAGLASLLGDLDQRGLLKETLVVAMGEFGRTPRLKKDGGRDHWPHCYSVLMAGGGVHGGLTCGRSDKAGAYPVADAVEARDVLATILTLLGIPNFAVDSLGRAAPLLEGANPIARLYT